MGGAKTESRSPRKIISLSDGPGSIPLRRFASGGRAPWKCTPGSFYALWPWRDPEMAGDRFAARWTEIDLQLAGGELLAGVLDDYPGKA